MKKILVTTDLSDNAKAGLRFALQLAAQNNYQLTFLHVYRILRPTSWSDAVYYSFEESEQEKAKNLLHKFVKDLHKSAGASVQKLNCVVQKGLASATEIIRYAEENKFDYICCSRSGAGKTTRLFGSTTSDLIKKSSIPVIAVPERYKKMPVKNITYASDLMHIDSELKQVAAFATPLHANVELLHFKAPIDYLMDAEQFELISRKLSDYNMTAHFNRLNYEETLIKNMNKLFDRTKPSMVIMFTKQKRSFFEKLFSSSISAEFAHLSKMPLLVFKKD